MRDLFLISAIAVMLFTLLRRPQIGILAWVWISVMNPHRLTYGWIYDFPLLDIVAATTLISALFHWKSRQAVRSQPVLVMLGLFYCWTSLTTLFSVDPWLAFGDWLAFTKTLILIVLVLLFMNQRHWTIALIAVFVISIAYTGLKGGVFTLLYGGEARVWGSEGTAWGDNNNVSVAMLMIIPLTLAARALFKSPALRLGALGATVAFFFALLGTQSRGGLVGLVGMSGYWAMRSQKKGATLLLLSLLLVSGYYFMPQSWHDRMATITTAGDSSAQTRLIQWRYAIDISLERPLFGNGFDAFFYKPYYRRYVAGKDVNRAVHSVYFQVLGEQGYIGLGLYLLIGLTLLRIGHRDSKRASACPRLKWEARCLEATQYGLVGFAVNGLTVNIAYLDLYYLMLTFVVLLSDQINQTLAAEHRERSNLSNQMFARTLAPSGKEPTINEDHRFGRGR